ncbi:Competence/damage-inducible protein CinA [Sulfitobacter noctilucae]|uniref:CinA family protein n=1 Tax=Sulfitobacter noctilucae TaxID=1342302 RepID=UPI000469F731|nr:CinA family protein [Sulfitobacter noctilucae]KIN60965.1 Competence/damage-inducible protein CinA [Sulfitobacter noctilucae]
MSLAAQILELAVQKNVMIACAESCTGGMVAAALTDLPGSSAMMERGFVTYTNSAKVDLLGVAQATLDAVGAVSEDVAGEMASGALAHSGAQIAVSTTGIAGPGGSEHKPEGRVCFGIATAQSTIVETQEFGALGRGAVRTAARDHALSLILQTLQNMP